MLSYISLKVYTNFGTLPELMFDTIKTIIGIVLVIIIIAVILFYLGLFVTA